MTQRAALRMTQEGGEATYLNTTGKVNITGTGFPACWPGVHFGEVETALTTSLSRSGWTPLTTFMSVTEPSFAIVNWRTTRPVAPLALADSG